MMEHFDCDDVGPINEYVGCKIEYNKEEKELRLT